MNVTILKSDNYLVFTNDFLIVPIVCNSLKNVEELVVSEVYRICNFLEKRLPKGCDFITVTEQKNVEFSVKNLDVNAFEFGFSNKAYKDVKNLLVQCVFSFKTMTDSLENCQNYQSYLANVISKTVGVVCQNGLIETAFFTLDYLEELFLKDAVLAYKTTYKLCFLITDFAKSVYIKNSLKNNPFYFEI